MKQEYIIKKFLKASSAAEALALDSDTPVSEVFLAVDKPVDGSSSSAIGFQTIYPFPEEN